MALQWTIRTTEVSTDRTLPKIRFQVSVDILIGDGVVWNPRVVHIALVAFIFLHWSRAWRDAKCCWPLDQVSPLGMNGRIYTPSSLRPLRVEVNVRPRCFWSTVESGTAPCRSFPPDDPDSSDPLIRRNFVFAPNLTDSKTLLRFGRGLACWMIYYTQIIVLDLCQSRYRNNRERVFISLRNTSCKISEWGSWVTLV